jgi:predicted PhzF superfamily epimerase YddE/YHI9
LPGRSLLLKKILSAQHKTILQNIEKSQDILAKHCNNMKRSMESAAKNKVKIAYGTDSFGSSAAYAKQSEDFAARLPWFTPCRDVPLRAWAGHPTPDTVKLKKEEYHKQCSFCP